jgi:hypothetical protein
MHPARILSFTYLLALVTAASAADPAPDPLTLPPGYTNARTATDPNRPQPATIVNELRAYNTLHSIGMEWDLTGDTNHNATCRVRYRRTDEATWHEALPLFRVDFGPWYYKNIGDRPYNMLAGSILFLRPGTEYVVQLDLLDPDGGATQREMTLRTLPVPDAGDAQRTWHVVPTTPQDATPGDGSAAKPFRGIAAAEAVARAGDVCLLHAGHYGTADFRRGGEAPGDRAGAQARYVVWRAADDKPPVFDLATIGADYVWLEGVTFVKNVDCRAALQAVHEPRGVVLRRNTFRGYHYSILLNAQSRGWYIADNDIVGDKPTGISGEGIELSKSPDHTVCYNRISQTADGISYPLRNCDLFGNDVFDVSDDGLEPDFGYANVRMWGNRLQGPMGITFQPMYCGPWYIVRNQVLSTAYVFKLRVLDRFVMANNTFVGWGRGGMATHAHTMLGALSRNNLWIYAGGGGATIWNTTVLTDPKNRDYSRNFVIYNTLRADWRSDLDYDGFDASLCTRHSREPAPKPFSWNSRRYETLAELHAEIGIEPHGRMVDRQRIFAAYDLPTEPTVARPVLTLNPRGEAVDAGVALPNLVEEFAGKTPDLGAFESGATPPEYGPGNGDWRSRHNEWVLRHQR